MDDYPIRNLYASQSSDVESAQMLDVFLGQANQHLLIFAGIAKPHWEGHDQDLNHEHVIVHFDQTVAAIVQASATIGLASIYNNGDEYGLGTEALTVIRDPATGHLALDALIVVQGDYTILQGFSYNASIVASIDEPYVAGVIQWNPSVTGRLGVPLVGPTHHSGPDATPPWFEIDAKRDLDPPPSDPPPPPPPPPVFTVPTTFAITHETRAVNSSDDLMQVPYSLRLGNIPSAVGDPFYLVGTILAGTFPHAHVQLRMDQTSGPNPITLSGSHLHEDGVNFFIGPTGVPQ